MTVGATALDSRRILPGYVAFLCHDDRYERYASILEDPPLQLERFVDVETMLARFMLAPPQALIMDLPTQARIGMASIGQFFEIDVSWPVMRCNVLANGAASVMCLDPNRSGNLPEALLGLTLDAEGWSRVGAESPYVKLRVNARAFIKFWPGEWERTNVTVLSAREVACVSYGEVEPGCRVTVKIHSLGKTPILETGSVVEVDGWESSAGLPLVRIRLDESAPSEPLRTALVELCSPERLLVKA